LRGQDGVVEYFGRVSPAPGNSWGLIEK
jgi:hypothetical protein